MWTLQDARNRFSAVVEAALAGRPQQVTRRGRPAVVVLAADDYQRLVADAAGRRESCAADLRALVDRTVRLFSDRLLPFGAADARIWGRLSQDIGHGGADLMIAATALARGGVVVTGNTEDFRPTGVQLENPF